MKRWWILSICFALYGFLPYRYAYARKTNASNRLLVDQQGCGCDCPDARIIRGTLLIPDKFHRTGLRFDSSQINLEIKGLDGRSNYSLGVADLYINGEMIGVDTVSCSDNGCDAVARFHVDNWRVSEYLCRMAVRPLWIDVLFFINLLMVLPMLIVLKIVARVRNKGRLKSGS
jgi:hypothetical protein